MEENYNYRYCNDEDILTINEYDNQNQQSEEMEVSRAIEESISSYHNDISNHETQQFMQTLQHQYEEEDMNIAIHDSVLSKKNYEKNITMNEFATTYTLSRSEEKKNGCWDCPRCTYVQIEPYKSNCMACGMKAPSHVLCFSSIPPELRYGLEIEIVIPNGASDGFKLSTLADKLAQLGPEKVVYLGYTHATSLDWKVVPDSSVRGDNDSNQDLCFELVSPILMGEAGLAQLRSIMENIRTLGVETNASCGFHVHVDGESGTLANLNAIKSISQCFVSLENAFDLLVSKKSNNTIKRASNQSRFCRSNRLAFSHMSNRQRWNTISNATSIKNVVLLMNPQHDRYRKLNLTNFTKYDRPSTYEFRHHGGVDDLLDAEAWVRLILLYCYNVVSNENHVMQRKCFLHEQASVKDELRALFDIIGCYGLQQFFTVDRKLFLECDMINAWSCKTCRREFNNSRSLSQHCHALGHQI